MSQRTKEIRKLVRAQIVYYIRQDLDGDELLMKEVWEELDGDREFVVAREEMVRIINAINAL